MLTLLAASEAAAGTASVGIATKNNTADRHGEALSNMQK
jgi:hypothetical protein